MGENLIERKTQQVEDVKLRCPCRTDSGCVIVDARLGWRHALDVEVCEQCLGLGGPDEEGGQAFVAQMAGSTLGQMVNLTHEGELLGGDVYVALRYVHGLLPDEVWKQGRVQNEVKRRIGWVRAKKSWEKATSFVSALASKALGKRLDPEVREKRNIACFGLDANGKRVSPPCQFLRWQGTKAWCGACGCGQNALAVLGTGLMSVDRYSKLDYPELECPLGKDGFSDHTDRTEEGGK